MGLLFRQGNFNIPPRKICGSGYEFSYFLVGDEIFSLQEYFMRPYAGSSLINDARKIFNHGVARVCWVTGNIFGILVTWWRILLRPLDVTPERVEKIFLVCVPLHN